jgi:shikimate kinase
VKQLIDERTPVYESVARHTVETDGLAADEVAARVRALVEDGAHE